MITAKERLLQFLEYIKMGQNAFEKKVKIANGYISHNKGSIGSSVIGKIAIAYPELNTSWLLTGDGRMLKDGFEKESEPPKLPTQLELDFSKVADACQRAVASVEKLADNNGVLISSNNNLAESNSKLIDQLITSLTRIEEKIDNREGALPESGSVLRSKRK